MKLRYLFFTFLLITQNSIYSGDFLKHYVKNDSNQKFFIGVIEEKQKLLDEFTKEQKELNASHKASTEKFTRQIDEIKTLQTKIESDLQKNADDDFLIKQQLILKESEQVLKDLQRTQDDNIALVTEIISHLQSFKNLLRFF